MTNEELNEKCCRFAGVEKELLDFPLYGWPRVSTDWAAAGRLMDALRIKHVWISIQSGTGWSVKVGVSPSMSAEAAELSLPMALALAVAELANVSEARP